MAGSAVNKPTSERRRQQNRMAQKNYRERQKRHLKQLQSLLESREVQPLDPLIDRQDQQLASNPAGTPADIFQTSQEGSVSDPTTYSRLSSHTGESFANMDPALLDAFRAPVPGWEAAEEIVSPRLNTSVTSQAIQTGKDDLPNTLLAPTINRLLLSAGNIGTDIRDRISTGQITINDILQVGIRTLAKDTSSHSLRSPSLSVPSASPTSPAESCFRTDRIVTLQNLAQKHLHSLPDVYSNHLRLKQLLTLAALTANVESLGISFEQLLVEETESPFYSGPMSEEAAGIACLIQFQHVSIHLRPTASQIRHSHHPYIDGLPFPTLRQRLLDLLQEDPAHFDEDEFCHDMASDGLICWGSTCEAEDRPTGAGAPWDLRSWEAQPWFLKKWWSILGGAEGELFQQSKWWHELRGDRLPDIW